jgi:transglutaminase-like putative cysteine protease
MRRLVLIAITAVVVLALVMAGSFVLFMDSRSPAGFEVGSLRAPAIVIETPTGRIYHTTSSNSDSPVNLGLNWTITPIYSGYGGVIDITVMNYESTPVYVYAIGLAWRDSGIETWRNVSAVITAHQQGSLGMLFFKAPANCTSGYYSLKLKVEVQDSSGSGWNDLKTYKITEDRYVKLEKPLKYLNHTTTTNNPVYYSKINKRVDMAVTNTLVSDILANNSHVYSIQAVADAFDWVQSHIAYQDDPNDYWQSASETLSWRTGDCEDQAILLASMIGQMGGNARVNIIDGHAFATVFIGSTAKVLDNVSKAISSHYQTNVPVYFLNDSTGYWMVIDSTGFPYAGGLPTLSGPVLYNASAAWSFESSTWLSQVDATGSTEGAGLLPF